MSIKFCPFCEKNWNTTPFCAYCGKDLRAFIEVLETAPSPSDDVSSPLISTAILTSNEDKGISSPNLLLTEKNSEDFVIESLGNREYVLVRYKGSEKNVIIPNIVTRIGKGAFKDYSDLTSIVIPDSVTKIGDEAFCNCHLSLTDITIPNSVTSIGDWAFHGCHNLTHITISDSVTSIGKFAFCDCNNLKSITIPKSVMSLGSAAFYNCSNLTSITLPRGYSNCILSYFGIDTSKTCIKFS